VRHGSLPPGLARQRTSDEFDATSVPAGLLRAHRIAGGVWGLLEVVAGTVTFVWEGDRDGSISLVAGDSVVIPPEVPHHVEPDPEARFRISFHR
jgi:tellurite resistance-related uncharacterized protein